MGGSGASGGSGGSGGSGASGGSGEAGGRDWFEAKSDGRQAAGGSGAAASGGAGAGVQDGDRPGPGGPDGPGGPGGPDGSKASGEPDGSAGDTGEFEPLHLRPYVSLYDAEAEAGADVDAHAEPSSEPDQSVYEAGGLLGPDGPLSWSIDDIWGPNESTGKNSAGNRQDAPGATADAAPTAAGEGSAATHSATHSAAHAGGAERSGDGSGGPSETDEEPSIPFGPAARTSALASDGFHDAHTDAGHTQDADGHTDDAGSGAGSPVHGPGDSRRRRTAARRGATGTAGATGTPGAAGTGGTGSHRAPSDVDPPEDPETQDEPTAPRRRRRAVLVGAGVAVVAVVALAVSGVFSPDKPSQDTALPGSDAATSVPTQEGAAPSESDPGDRAPATPGSPAAPTSKAAPPSPSGATSHPAPPPSGAPTAGATGTVQPAPPEGPTGPPVLRVGDQGAEVKELQLRLRQLLLYLGTADGVYDSGLEDVVGNYQRSRDIKGDEEGVYGPATRHQLESETREP